MSSTVVAAFRWLDVLEKEFDKAFVDLDLMLNDLLSEAESGDLVEDAINDFIDGARDKVKAMCSAWAQLVHKSQTIFQTNCKLEAQLLNAKSDAVEARAFKQAAEKELEKIMIELHSSQLQLQKYKSAAAANGMQAPVDTNNNVNSETDQIKKRLDEELARRFGKENQAMALALAQNELEVVRRENETLREQLVQANSEIYGAKLAAKYLDKELAGRIQQIQLFGKALKPEEHERLWNQLEAEIYLHRHKTIIRACRGKRLLKHKSKLVDASPSSSTTEVTASSATQTAASVSNTGLNGAATTTTTTTATSSSSSSSTTGGTAPNSTSSRSKPHRHHNDDDEEEDDVDDDDDDVSHQHHHLNSSYQKIRDLGQVRTVRLRRNEPKEGLGISITGGSEHGVPILVSEIHDNGPAARSGELLIGDAILSANGIDLKEAMHNEAVKILSGLTGDVELKVFFVAPDDDSEIDEANSVVDGTYPFLEEQDTISIKSKSMTTNDGKQQPQIVRASNDDVSIGKSSNKKEADSSPTISSVEVKAKNNSISSSYDTQSIASASNDAASNADKRSLLGKLDKISKALESK